MLHSNYNLLTLQDLPPSDTYFDKLPKDLIWYMLGYTGPQDGYIVMKKPYFNRGPLEIVKATTLYTKEELLNKYMSVNYYGPQFLVEKVKYVFIDGKQYAAVPIKCRIDGFTPPDDDKSHLKRCIGKTLSGKRCKRKTHDSNNLCVTHRAMDLENKSPF
jgi:hypothetical protein